MEAQHEYYAAHKLVITSALDAGVTDTMEKQPADPVLHLGKQLVASAEKAAGIRRLTLEEAEELMAAESAGFELHFLGLDNHVGGLGYILGPPPRRDFLGAMEREHCASSDSRQIFTPSNYSIQTTPRMEWWAVIDPVGGLKVLGIGSYPKESAEKLAPEKQRKLLPRNELEAVMDRLNARLAEMGVSTQLKFFEVVAMRLYSGTMYSKYSAIVRKGGDGFDKGEKPGYVATIYALASGIGKLAKLSKVEKGYRGIGLRLPSSFFHPDAQGLRGGTEVGFCSFTPDKEVALSYAGAGGAFFEFDDSYASKGANLSELSYYPFEGERVLPPLTFFEVKAARLEGRILFVEITPQLPITELVEEDYMMYTDLVSAERRRLCDVATAYVSGEANARERFAAANTMTTGQPADAAFGINRYLGLSDKEIWGKMALGLEQIEREIKASGNEDAIECLEYVLRGNNGSNSKLWPHSSNRMMDRFYTTATSDAIDDSLHDGRAEQGLEYFVNHQNAKDAGLLPEHVVAVRLYTTAAFRLINVPFFAAMAALNKGEKVPPHPAPTLAAYVTDGVKRLRGLLGRDRETKDATLELWRGNYGLVLDDEFRKHGGTQVSPMSTSDDVQVALNYSKEHKNRVIFKIVTHGFMEQGAPIRWLSAFPGESEYLYPPLTYLKPTGVEETFDVEGVHITALEVVASM